MYKWYLFTLSFSLFRSLAHSLTHSPSQKSGFMGLRTNAKYMYMLISQQCCRILWNHSCVMFGNKNVELSLHGAEQHKITSEWDWWCFVIIITLSKNLKRNALIPLCTLRIGVKIGERCHLSVCALFQLLRVDRLRNFICIKWCHRKIDDVCGIITDTNCYYNCTMNYTVEYELILCLSSLFISSFPSYDLSHRSSHFFLISTSSTEITVHLFFTLAWHRVSIFNPELINSCETIICIFIVFYKHFSLCWSTKQ